ncbi:MAG: PQQ-binding-like beta-propeller repeat protein [Planctomycetota bacterium]
MNNSLAVGTALALLAAPAFAQSTVTWIDPLQEPNLDVRNAVECLAHPDGGVVSIFYADQDTAPGYVVRRLDDLGDRAWTTFVPERVDGDFRSLGPSTVGPNGTAYLSFFYTDPDRASQIVALDPGGDLLWEIDVPTTIGNTQFGIASIHGTFDGDVIVTGLMDSFLIPPLAGASGVRRYDGATGAPVWSYERTAISWVRGRSFGDTTYLFTSTGFGVQIEALDGQGTLLFTTYASVPVHFVNRSLPAFAAVGPQGQAAFAIGEAFTPGGTYFYAVAPTGALTWNGVQPLTMDANVGAFLPNGDLVVAESGFHGRIAACLDPSAGVVWQDTSAVATRGYRQIEPGPGANVTLYASEQVMPYPYSAAALEYRDAATGQVLDVERFEQTDAIYALSSTLAKDSRGNLWVGLMGWTGILDPTNGETVKVVPFDDASAVECAAATANSTGDTGRLRAPGSPVVALDNLSLVADRLPPFQFVLFLNAQSSGSTANPGGSQGDLCLGGSIGRYVAPGQIRRASPAGLATLQLDLDATPSGATLVPIAAGETWYFQAWHRDLVGGAATSNFTGAVSVAFQ